MRDPARIDRIIEKLRQFWHEVPDWRFGQLASNLRTTRAEEDDEFERRLDEVVFITDGPSLCDRVATLTDPPRPAPSCNRLMPLSSGALSQRCSLLDGHDGPHVTRRGKQWGGPADVGTVYRPRP